MGINVNPIDSTVVAIYGGDLGSVRRDSDARAPRAVGRGKVEYSRVQVSADDLGIAYRMSLAIDYVNLQVNNHAGVD